ncbi:GNAT family N-acetyltransferase [Dictyobacter arantiisoli]|nr:GNAT family N-acetyltransferase [Dictyobacter arantiisoli]
MSYERRPYPTGAKESYLWTWWKHDPLPTLPVLEGWHIETAREVPFAAKISNIPIKSVEARYSAGHYPILAYLNDTLVAYGWLGINQASFGSPAITFNLPAKSIYLYHFVTLLPWRGRGYYPRLLQAILERESRAYEHFWIMHQTTNRASQHGIEKAGFQPVARTIHISSNQLALIPTGDPERAQQASILLGLPLKTS